MGYDYSRLKDGAENIGKNGASIFKIGKSYEGRDIICIHTGKGEKKLLLTGAFHGMESITSLFLIKFMNEYLHKAKINTEFFGRDAGRLINSVSLYCIPMVNPDGVEIAENKYWQANARGVDINHNFDAGWSSVLNAPSPSKYGGEYPESEKETKAVADFIRRERFDMLLCFHSQGEEIYYEFEGRSGENGEEIARAMSEESGYKVCRPEGTAAFGGCKDWFIKEFSRCGFTIEMGKGENPLPLDMIKEIYEPCSKIILTAMEKLLR